MLDLGKGQIVLVLVSMDLRAGCHPEQNLEARYVENCGQEFTYIKVWNYVSLKKLINDTIKEKGLDCDLNFIDVSDIRDMSHIFEGADFNGDISAWNVSNVKDMSNMFCSSKFNGDISNWNVSNVIDMNHMFEDSEFNSDISTWDVSNVKDMSSMFC